MGGKMAEEWVEATLTSSQDQSGITTKLWRNYPEQTTEQQQKEKPYNLGQTEEPPAAQSDW